jgi:hypothetical protein
LPGLDRGQKLVFLFFLREYTGMKSFFQLALLFALFSLSAHPAFADVKCTYFLPNGPKESVTFYDLGNGPIKEILIARFTGPQPDLYFLATKLKFAPSEQTTYEQFAERSDLREAPKLKINHHSQIRAFSEWTRDGKTYQIVCPTTPNEKGS